MDGLKADAAAIIRRGGAARQCCCSEVLRSSSTHALSRSIAMTLSSIVRSISARRHSSNWLRRRAHGRFPICQPVTWEARASKYVVLPIDKLTLFQRRWFVWGENTPKLKLVSAWQKTVP